MLPNSGIIGRMKKRNRIRSWGLSLLALVFMGWFAAISRGSLKGLIGGYSAVSLCILALFAAAAVLYGIRGAHPADTNPAAGAMLGMGFLSASLLLLLGYILPEKYLPYAHRLRPLLLFLMLIAVSGLFMRYVPEPLNWKGFLLFFAIGISLWGFIALSGLGIVPDEMDWQPTGMTIQYWEIAASVLGAMILAALLYRIQDSAWITPILFFLIWAGSAVLWVSIPTMEVLKGSYFMEITAPNDLPYPASDSANFGVWVESILAGLGFKSAIAYRQFLIVVLAFFETLTKGDILKTIDLLTITLALIPACMFLLGTRLHSRSAGMLAAGMALLREYNTILLGPHYMVSNAKMWLSDLPAMLVLLAAVCAAVGWIQHPQSLRRAVLAGCLMGLGVTVRSQFIVLIPFPALFYLFEKNEKKWRQTLIFLLSALMVIAPWFIRAKIITGDFILDDPGVHSTELARRYSDDVTNKVTRAPGESDAEYAARNKQHMVDFFLEKPGYVIRFVMSHFFANEIYGLCALPFGTDPLLTIRDVTNTDFHNVPGRLLGKDSQPSVFCFIALIAVGMAACWKRNKWAGMLPFFMCSLYLGSTSVARYSGWRFALPGDWHFYFYAALGLADMVLGIAVRCGADRKRLFTTDQMKPERDCRWAISGTLALFLILGAVPALVNYLPDQIQPNSRQENTRTLDELAQKWPEEMAGILPIREDQEILNGRDLYPRFFYAGAGLSSGHPWPPYRVRDFARLGFVLLNAENHDVILPLSEEPSFVPHAADVIIIGKETGEGWFLAETMVIPGEGAPRVIRSDEVIDEH